MVPVSSSGYIWLRQRRQDKERQQCKYFFVAPRRKKSAQEHKKEGYICAGANKIE